MRQNVEKKNLEKGRQFFHKQLTRKCHNEQKTFRIHNFGYFLPNRKILGFRRQILFCFQSWENWEKNSCCTENSPGNCQTFRNKTAFSIQKHQQTKYSKPFHCVVHKALFKSYNYSTYVHAIVSISKRVSPQRP